MSGEVKNAAAVFFGMVREDADPLSLFTEYRDDGGDFTLRYGIGGWGQDGEFFAWGDVVWEHTRKPNPYVKDLHDTVSAPGEMCLYSGSDMDEAESVFFDAVSLSMSRKGVM